MKKDRERKTAKDKLKNFRGHAKEMFTFRWFSERWIQAVHVIATVTVITKQKLVLSTQLYKKNTFDFYNEHFP